MLRWISEVPPPIVAATAPSEPRDHFARSGVSGSSGSQSQPKRPSVYSAVQAIRWTSWSVKSFCIDAS